MMGKLASLFIEISAKTSKLDAGFAAVRRGALGLAGGVSASMGGMANGIQARMSAMAAGVAATLARVGAVGGLALAAGVASSVKKSSDLSESLSKTDAVFGQSSGAIKSFADKMAADFGLVKTETLDASARFAGLGKGIGALSGGKLTKFSTDMVKLAADMSSFQNISFDEAITAISSGLSGETSR